MDRKREQVLDQMLVMAAQDGSEDAWRALVDRWHPRLWRFARRLTGRPEGAWEVSQEAWLGIVRGLRRLHDPAAFGTWAYRIVSNKAASWIRTRQRRRHEHALLNPADEPKAATESPAGDADPTLEAMLDGLPAAARTVLTLYYLEAMPVSEVAQVLAIPAGTVKSRLHHARAALRDAFERYEKKRA